MLHPGDIEVVRLAHTSSFSEFIRNDNEDLQLHISDFHFRQLYRSGWEPLDAEPSAPSEVRRRIERMPWFYMAETPEASCLLLPRLFPDRAAQHIPCDNRSAGVADPIHAEDAGYLANINRLDYDMYGCALELQHSRLIQASLVHLEDGDRQALGEKPSDADNLPLS